jgi:hypothetical protein
MEHVHGIDSLMHGVVCVDCELCGLSDTALLSDKANTALLSTVA